MGMWARWITGSGATYENLVEEWQRDCMLPRPDKEETGPTA